MFKKKLISSEGEEDDDYEYIGNKSDVKLNKSNFSSASIKNENPTSGLSAIDKKVRCYINCIIIVKFVLFDCKVHLK